MAGRVVVAVVAVAVIAWLAVMERDERLQRRGVAAAEAGDFSRAQASFRDARLLNPDTLPDLSLAFLLQGAGRAAEAARLLGDVLRREPDNRSAWGQYLNLQGERDPAAAERARAALRRLDPVNARDR